MKNSNKFPTVASDIQSAQRHVLSEFPNAVLFGLGVNDPKGTFGTTLALSSEFGTQRVFETPTSENASLGVALGLAISGFKPIVVHQRMDFFLLAMDQLVNAAAKWRFMFGDSYESSILIRLIVGRGWGQGPTHSQNLHAWFTHIPGIRVFYPSRGRDFKYVIQNTFEQVWPTILIEDRWVHQVVSEVKGLECDIAFEPTRIVSEGEDLTVISFGFNTILALDVVKFYEKHHVSIELIEIIALKPLNMTKILDSVRKTGRLLIIDSGFEFASLGSYVSHLVSRALFSQILLPIRVLSSGDIPEPTSWGVIEEFKISAVQIAEEIREMLNLKSNFDFRELIPEYQDVPTSNYQGPF